MPCGAVPATVHGSSEARQGGPAAGRPGPFSATRAPPAGWPRGAGPVLPVPVLGRPSEAHPSAGWFPSSSHLAVPSLAGGPKPPGPSEAVSVPPPLVPTETELWPCLDGTEAGLGMRGLGVVGSRVMGAFGAGVTWPSEQG